MAFTVAEKRALRTGISVGIAVAAYGVSFGALSVAAGLDTWQTCFLSLVLFSGGSQFAVIGILASGGASAGIPAVASSTFLALRNGIYSMRVAPIVGKVPLWKRLTAAQITIDESTAVAIAQEEKSAQRVGFWATGIAIYIGWNLATFAGALLGNLVGDVSRFGLDAVAAAAFVGLLWPRLQQLQAAAVAMVSAVLAAFLIPLTPPGVPVLAAAVVAVVFGLTNWLHREPAADAQRTQPDDLPEPGDTPGYHPDHGQVKP
ncbi:branched-chain amino acid ABC transporter permease [Aurantimicrobium sp. INA4]|nr:branched-chain amino acid ABC transporter permease [Aurantimicrobium sp. INA4]